MLPLTSVRSFRPADWVIAFVILGLFAGPALVLAFAERPGRFGFQMYSGYGAVEATWRDSSGTDHPIDLSAFVSSARHEVDWPAVLPEALCHHLPEAVRVDVRQERAGGTVHRVAAC